MLKGTGIDRNEIGVVGRTYEQPHFKTLMSLEVTEGPVPGAREGKC
jgi:hypothetical protein